VPRPSGRDRRIADAFATRKDGSISAGLSANGASRSSHRRPASRSPAATASDLALFPLPDLLGDEQRLAGKPNSRPIAQSIGQRDQRQRVGADDQIELALRLGGEGGQQGSYLRTSKTPPLLDRPAAGLGVAPEILLALAATVIERRSAPRRKISRSDTAHGACISEPL
jgi:hypothetical protein